MLIIILIIILIIFYIVKPVHINKFNNIYLKKLNNNIQQPSIDYLRNNQDTYFRGDSQLKYPNKPYDNYADNIAYDLQNNFSSPNPIQNNVSWDPYSYDLVQSPDGKFEGKISSN